MLQQYSLNEDTLHEGIAMMKLYPIIYLNEAARTAEESLTKGVFAVVTRGPTSVYYNGIVLFDSSRILRSLRIAAKDGNLDADSKEPNDVFTNLVVTKAARSAYVGAITYVQAQQHKKDEKLYYISTSAGVSDFGPLAYQIVMYHIDPAWLASDTNIKPAAIRVWQKMYQFSDNGIYQRKFLGEFSVDDVYERSKNIIDHFRKLKDLFETSQSILSEQKFLDFVKQKTDLTPQELGYLWCYKKISHDPKIVDMFLRGDEVVLEMTKYGVDSEKAKTMLKHAAAMFFQRLYGGPASL